MPPWIVGRQVQQLEGSIERALEPVAALLLGPDRSSDLGADIAELFRQGAGVPAGGVDTLLEAHGRTSRATTSATLILMAGSSTPVVRLP